MKTLILYFMLMAIGAGIWALINWIKNSQAEVTANLSEVLARDRMNFSAVVANVVVIIAGFMFINL